MEPGAERKALMPQISLLLSLQPTARHASVAKEAILMKMFILLDIGGVFQASACASLYPIKPPRGKMHNKKCIFCKKRFGAGQVLALFRLEFAEECLRPGRVACEGSEELIRRPGVPLGEDGFPVGVRGGGIEQALVGIA